MHRAAGEARQTCACYSIGECQNYHAEDADDDVKRSGPRCRDKWSENTVRQSGNHSGLLAPRSARNFICALLAFSALEILYFTMYINTRGNCRYSIIISDSAFVCKYCINKYKLCICCWIGWNWIELDCGFKRWPGLSFSRTKSILMARTADALQFNTNRHRYNVDVCIPMNNEIWK